MNHERAVRCRGNITRKYTTPRPSVKSPESNAVPGIPSLLPDRRPAGSY
jgi:hypothetical protein